MSQSIRDFEKSFKVGTDLSAKQYYIMAVDTANDEGIVIGAASTDPIVGVLQNKPKGTSGANVPGLVRFIGTSKVIAGGTITRGDRVTTDSNGKAVTTTTNKDVLVGIALQSAVSGDIFEVLLNVGNKQSF